MGPFDDSGDGFCWKLNGYATTKCIPEMSPSNWMNFFCGFLYLIEEDNFRMLNSKAHYNFNNEFHKSLLCSWFRHKHWLKTVEMIARLHLNWFLEDYPEYFTWLLHFIFILPEKHLRSLSAPIYNLCIRYGEHGK